jgi:hypothetical protein
LTQALADIQENTIFATMRI